MRPVIFAHGLEGRPDGTKPRALRAAGLDPICPDGRGLPLQPRVDGIRAAVAAHPGALLIGSSYGGLAALFVAAEAPERLSGLLLLAPALHWSEPPATHPERLCVPATLPTAVLHGVRDDVVPIAVSRALRDRCPHVVLHEVDDDHLLHASLERIVALARAS